MKTILVATDYSNAANNAVHYGAALARESEAKLILFNAFKIPPHAANTLLSATGVTELLKENKLKLKLQASSITKQYGIETEVITNISYVAEEVERLALKLKADLVVMGMRGKNAEPGFFGSVTTFVIGQGTLPVLVVPEEAGYKGIERILFACDTHCLAPENRLPLLREMAQIFRAKVEVLQVHKLGAPAEVAEVNEFAGPSGMEEILDGVVHDYRDISDDHILGGIDRGVREFEADMLVMVPHHTGFWNTLFNRSKTRKMAMLTEVPLLSIPNPHA